MMVTNHFRHFLREWMLEMDDPRNQSYIKYTQTACTPVGDSLKDAGKRTGAIS